MSTKEELIHQEIINFKRNYIRGGCISMTKVDDVYTFIVKEEDDMEGLFLLLCTINYKLSKVKKDKYLTIEIKPV